MLINVSFVQRVISFIFFVYRSRSNIFRMGCEINSLNSSWMHVGRPILVRVFSTDFQTSRIPTRVILKNVSWFTGEKDLKLHFGRFGKVQHVKLLYDWETGLHRGFAFVVFDSIDDAVKAVQQRNHYINGRQVIAKIAVPSPGKRQK
ncbi:unnamed protein product [Litomosoides sigmodontis]|uniref:RRM domain-containing protein n=1 Tax=Litomosoides sigmodontis TaxID=42156 RepID=A0A3P6TUS7_LITSI|nr:unnamed protein product [Litomosoides sigmodontis]